MSHVLTALLTAAAIFGGLYLYILWNERQWRKHEEYWDYE